MPLRDGFGAKRRRGQRGRRTEVCAAGGADEQADQMLVVVIVIVGFTSRDLACLARVLIGSGRRSLGMRRASMVLSQVRMDGRMGAGPCRLGEGRQQQHVGSPPGPNGHDESG